MMSLEDLLKLKKKAKLNNTQISELSGVPLGTVNKVLSGGTKNPRRMTLEAIENALLKCTSYTSGGEEEPVLMLQEDPLSYSYIAGSSPKRLSDKDVPSMLRERIMRSDRRQAELMLLCEVAGTDGKKQGEYTVEDYYRLSEDRRLELIDGVLYDMSSPRVRHQRIIGTLYWQIYSFIREKGGPCEVLLSPMDVHFPNDDKTVVQPDLQIVCDPGKLNEWVMDTPDFVVEIVSPSSVQKDCVVKARKYQETGVREYWIIDPMQKMVIAYDFENGTPVRMQSLEGSMDVLIYGGELKIDLEEIRRAAE